MWKTIKNIRTSRKQGPYLGSITNRDWLSHFKELLEENRKEYLQEPLSMQETPHINLEIGKVQEAINSTKLRRSPGPGSINPEFIKYGPRKLTEMLTTLYERYYLKM